MTDLFWICITIGVCSCIVLWCVSEMLRGVVRVMGLQHSITMKEIERLRFDMIRDAEDWDDDDDDPDDDDDEDPDDGGDNPEVFNSLDDAVRETFKRGSMVIGVVKSGGSPADHPHAVCQVCGNEQCVRCNPDCVKCGVTFYQE